MPPPPKADIPKAATPRYGSSFDPWNSSSTGHQRAENRLGGSTSWRESRSTKLQSQFEGGAVGGKRMSDAVEAGSKHWDNKAQAIIPPDLRTRATFSVMEMLATPGTMKQSFGKSAPAPVKGNVESITAMEKSMARRQAEDEAREEIHERPRKLFDGIVIYINGSTYPTISDHKLKHILAEHGARISIHLGRRQVTHVILGRSSGGGGGAGGGLAGGKLQKEIQKVGGAAVKFVGVEWILESIKARKRLPEARFSNLKIAPMGQQGVFSMASRVTTPTLAVDNESSINQSQVVRSNAHAPTPRDDEPPPSGQRSYI
ncbi:hypothetical protein BKA67DRAFT_659569 [Truncatella angustata]|uniref:BRCT domain-containing protein n=1 Tax=Truncatella angustata TaxID=152316 RepID=A0A9P8UIS3_9PEZI|nr:uncharacterized protein BKA67DRAFT_659569 [Truncatella angustata]KAH6652912.1 hypothetical protein BKA67DRAFT_659569 [Truncatella angustata]KAH8197225.1 hypothetical protein TruAng_008612 [Truncatella angustata]